MKVTKRWIKFFSAFLALTLLLAGCSGPETPSTPPPETSQAAPAEPPAPEPEPDRAVLVATGDNLIHDVIYRQAQARSEDGGFDFAPAYRQIAPIVAEADFAFINQETLLAGDQLPLSSYPCFCSPTQLGDHLISLGFNLFSTANNHSLDKGVQGIPAGPVQALGSLPPGFFPMGGGICQGFPVDRGKRLPALRRAPRFKVQGLQPGGVPSRRLMRRAHMDCPAGSIQCSFIKS